jgi:hypothetical protein
MTAVRELPTNRHQPSTHAVVFHSVAGSFLGSEGFILAHGPGTVGKRADLNAVSAPGSWMI